MTVNKEDEINDIFSSMNNISLENNIYSRDSSEYKEAEMLNKVNRERNNIDDPLTVSLKEAKHIKDDIKDKYIHLAELYLEDMQKNLFKNQFQLEESYPEYTADEWNDFLSDRIVSVYIQKHKRTLLKTAAEDNLVNPYAKNKRDNLKIIEGIKNEEQQESQKNIVILRIPDIYDD
jgi:hypothetical protein